MFLDDKGGYRKDSGIIMKIFIGADHRGFKLKQKVIKFLNAKKYDVIDVGTYVEGKPCDYPLISKRVAQAVVKTKGARGILVCMTGIGNSIAANKVCGIRAALCYNAKAAYFSRAHNDANVLVVGSKFVKGQDIFRIVTTWLNAKFEGGRHLRRVNQIKKIEKECC